MSERNVRSEEMIDTQNHGQIRPDQRRFIVLDPVKPLQLVYKHVCIDAQVQVDDPEIRAWHGGVGKRNVSKRILKSCSGKFSPGTFTALLGPSGSGKTTMLNLLSGRLHSSNLTPYGFLQVNGQKTRNITDFKKDIGYVMQDDIMLATFTPYQTFKFVTDLRLPYKTQSQKQDLIERLILSLSLMECKNTYVGNNMIKGISGGQMKRTSIGIQLLMNPSLLFLDEPTTGLDSKTALDLIFLLKSLARSGRTVISTIHQPSSEIFLEFDQLMLMVDGNIIYHGGSTDSIKYFQDLGFPVPENQNPFDHYIHMMNKEELALEFIENEQDYDDELITKKFEQRVNMFVRRFKSCLQKIQHSENLQNIEQSKDEIQAGFCTQILYVAKRSFTNQFRNPMDILAKFIQTIFFAVITIIFFEKRATNFKNFDQNLNGAVFFIILAISFAGIFGILNVFNGQRSVFIRQSSSGLYRTVPYFIGRSIATFPGSLIVPVLYVSICYFPINLYNTAGVYFYTILSAILTFWMSEGYGIFFSALLSDPVLVMSSVPMIVFPLTFVSGFFLPLNKVSEIYRPFEYISVWKYAYQAVIRLQYIDGAGFANFPGQYPINPETMESDPNYILQTDQYNFTEALWADLFSMFMIGLFLKVVAAFVMKLTSQAKRIDLLPPIQQQFVQRDQFASQHNGRNHASQFKNNNQIIKSKKHIIQLRTKNVQLNFGVQQ